MANSLNAKIESFEKAKWIVGCMKKTFTGVDLIYNIKETVDKETGFYVVSLEIIDRPPQKPIASPEQLKDMSPAQVEMLAQIAAQDKKFNEKEW